MKKILNLLGAISITAFSSTSVISCGNKVNPIINLTEMEKLISEFKKEVNEIINNHIFETKNNFFLVDKVNNESLNFLKKDKINNFMGDKTEKTANDSIRQELINDFNNLFEIGKLEEKINALQKKEKYSIILSDSDRVFKNYTISENEQILITSKTNGNNVWFSTFKFEFSIAVNFKNTKSQIEEYKVEDINTLIFLTDSEKIGGDIKEMYQNAEKVLLKDNLSRLYIEELDLGSKSYLENTDSELKKHLNSSNFTNNFIKFIKEKFDIDISFLEKKAVERFDTVASYRSNKISYGVENNKENPKVQNYIDILFKNKEADVSTIINETKEESETYIIKEIENNLNRIDKDLINDTSLTDLTEGSLNMKKVNATNLHYKIDLNEYVEIPDLTLTFGYLKNKNSLTRKKIDEDIAQNINLAKNKLWDIFELTNETVNRTRIMQFKRTSKIWDIWWNKMGIYNKKDNIDKYTNLADPYLTDYRNKFIKEAKQNDFVFTLTWPEKNEFNQKLFTQSRNVPGSGIINGIGIGTEKSQYPYFQLNYKLNFEIDYLKFDFTLKKQDTYENLFSF